MQEKYRVLFFKYIYELLELNKYENELIKNNISYIDKENLMDEKEKICLKYSKYFYLLNEINFELLKEEEIEYLENINNEELTNEVISFLKKTYGRVLLYNSPNEKTYYGPFMNPRFEVDSDGIGIGLKFEEFGLVNGPRKNLESLRKDSKIIEKIINEIENKQIGIKFKILKYNEMYEPLNRNTSFKM